MENQYKRLNNVVGWIVCIIASYTYISTIEPTASFWDCGEFIASAFKLEVGHPPGAPFWMLIARAFSLFAGENLELVPICVNIFSALSTSFSILFLYWSITALAKKVALQSGPLTTASNWVIVSSGAIGALAFTFTDSVWFSAVEGEVYASSQFFTAIVFWLILKWEANSDNPRSDKYLILIAYIMGLSIGVHLLNLLTIPALVYVYYFKKTKEVTPAGFVKAGIIGVLILAVVQYGIIQRLIKIASDFELFFVNTLGMGFNSGLIAFTIFLIAAVVFGLMYTHKRKWVNVNKAILCFVVIVLGYSSFATIVIRSAANTPMDENNPENVFSLIPYLNREQYGDRPLLYGQTFNSRHTGYEDGDPTYYKDENKSDKYLVGDDGKDKYPKYAPETMKVFPRMYSSDGKHKRKYKRWSNWDKNSGKDVYVGGRKIKIPTMGEDLSFMARYQINFMYWRYFMWNFVGRQNDLQSTDMEEKTTGNWISGIEFIDKEHVGDSSILPDNLKNNKGRNTYFFIPFILGLIGMIFHFTRSQKDGFIVFLLFFMTGLAIIIYLNQTPVQPRERDYAFVGSFYAFAIWIGLGVQALYYFMRNLGSDVKKLPFLKQLEANDSKEVVLFGAGFFGLGIFAIMADQKAVAYSLMFIGAVMAITPLFLMYLGQAVRDEKTKGIVALLITAVAPIILAANNWDDHDRSNRYASTDFAKNYLNSCAKNAILFTMGDNDTFPLWYVQEVEDYRTDVRVVNLSLLNTDWYINQMKRRAYDGAPVPFSMTEDQYRQGTRNAIFVKSLKNDTIDVDKAIAFVKSDNPDTKWRPRGSNKAYNYIPRKFISVPVDKEAAIKGGSVTPQYLDKVPNEIVLEFEDDDLIYKNNMMILDLLATNDWERPIYFAVTVGVDNFFGLEQYFRADGLTYCLTPIKSNSGRGMYSHVDVDTLYNNMMEKFNWGNIGDTTIYIDEQYDRQSQNLKRTMIDLARKLVSKKDTVRATKVLNKILETFPNKNFTYDESVIDLAVLLNQVGESEKGESVFSLARKNIRQKLKYQRTLFEEHPTSQSDNRSSFEMAYFAIEGWSSIIRYSNPQNGEFKVSEEEYELMIEEFGSAAESVYRIGVGLNLHTGKGRTAGMMGNLQRYSQAQ